MPSKKKPTKTTGSSAKEELPDPATLKNGTSVTYIGGWSAFDSVESIRLVSEQVTAANTGADGVVAPLPRTNIFLLPSEPAGASASAEVSNGDDASAQPVTVEVADQMNIEGISRQQCGRADGAVKTWARPVSAASAAAAAAAENDAADAPSEDPPAPAPAFVNPFEDAIHDPRYSQTVAVGASYAACDVVIGGSCSVEGMPPKIVVPPQLPTKPDLDAVTLDEPANAAAAAEEAAAAASGAGKAKKPTSAAKKNAKKGKPKLTPEQLEELERKKAAVEAEYLQQTEQAVQQAQEEADYRMTFAHPDRWAHVVFRHITFAGPVVVRRAHVTFQNCRFTYSGAGRPQLVVSQYCRVNCTKCTFEAPQRCAVYGLPSATVTVRKCLFTGVPQGVLWSANVPGLGLQAGGAAADITSDDVNADAAAGEDDADVDGSGLGGGDGNTGSRRGAGGPSTALVLAGELQAAVHGALQRRSASVGIQTDSARLQVHACAFLALGVGVYVRGSYTAYVTRRAVPPRSAQQLASDACDTVVAANSFHHFANTAVLLDKTARLVGLRRNFVEACAYYGLDCQSGSKSVLVRGNYFTADAVVRIREGASVALLHNDFQSIPVNDNGHDNPCLQPVY